MAKRRRVLREQTSVMSEFGDDTVGDQDHSAAVDVPPTDDDINKPPQTMNNFYIISAIPYLPKTVAAVCLVLNVIIPGSGRHRIASSVLR